MGLEPEELAPASDAWTERIHPGDFAAHRKEIELALISGRGWNTTYRIRDARGRYRSMLERGHIQRNSNGDPVRAIGCCVDVSEIKRLTDLLAETQSAAQMGGWEYSHPTRELTWTEEMFRIYETTPADFTVSWDSMLEQCTPESLERYYAAIARAESGDGHLDLELEIITLKGRRIWVRMIGHLERLDGKLFREFGSLQNIQAQKLSQIALETNTEWLKLSMNMANIHGWRWDKARDVLEFANRRRPGEASARGLPGLKESLVRMHPDDRLAATRAIKHAFSHRTEIHEEFRLQAKRRQLPLVRHDRETAVRRGRRAERPRRRDARCDAAARVGGAIAPLRTAAACDHREYRGHAAADRYGHARSIHQQDPCAA